MRSIAQAIGAFLCLLVTAGPALHAQSTAANCRLALDYTNKIHEKLVAGATNEELKQISSDIETLVGNCPVANDKKLADLWYLRSRVEGKLAETAPGKQKPGLANRASTYLRKSKEAGSELAAKNLDPFLAPAELVAAPPERLGRKYALLVGVDKFKELEGSPRIPSLRFAGKDAIDLGNFLTGKTGRFPKENVEILTGEAATLENVRSGIGHLRKSKPEDMVLIFLSSHGSPRSDDPNGVSYIMMHDTNLANDEKRYATSLQMVGLVEELKREIKARRMVLILDTCYSGGAGDAPKDGSKRVIPLGTGPSSNGWGGASVSGILSTLSNGTGRAIISASRADEESWESTSFQNGYFTHFLLEGLRVNQGLTPLRDVFAAASRKTAHAVFNEKSGAKQTPQWQGTATAEAIIIGAPEGAAAQ
jgi:uncharacterized caspase-like protein